MSAALQSFLGHKDVLPLVFQRLRAGVTDDIQERRKLLIEERRNLVSAALTCLDFFDPAIDVLWRDMQSLVPLFNLLQPAFVKQDTAYTIHGEISDKALKRFDVYARRIRSLFLIQDGEDKIASHVFFCIARLRPSLLPNLTTLDFSLIEKADIEKYAVAFFLPSPSLFTMKITVWDDSSQVEDFAVSFLENLVGQAPFVSSLFLTISPPGNALVKCVHGFRKLKTLNLTFNFTDFSSDSLTSLSGAEHLEHLQVAVHSCMSQPPRYNRVIHLPSLQSLNVNANALDIFSILRAIDLSRLLKIDIAFVMERAASAADLSSSIAHCAAMTQSLQHFAVLISKRGLHAETGQLPRGTLSPLVRCNLQSLQIRDFTLKDHGSEVPALFVGGHWARLRTLHLPAFVETALPLSQLHILALHCPVLMTLHIHLDTSSIDAHLQQQLTQPRLLHPLKELTIGRKKLEGPQPSGPSDLDTLISRYIDHTFPFIDKFPPFDRWKDSDDVWWRRISGTIQGYQKIRKQEQKRI